MLTLIQQLLFDPRVFLAAVTSARSRLRGYLALLGALLAANVITLNDLGDMFGKIGWCIGWACLVLPHFISSGDITPPELKLLAEQLRVANKPAVLNDNPPVPTDVVAVAEKEKTL